MKDILQSIKDASYHRCKLLLESDDVEKLNIHIDSLNKKIESLKRNDFIRDDVCRDLKVIIEEKKKIILELKADLYDLRLESKTE